MPTTIDRHLQSLFPTEAGSAWPTGAQASSWPGTSQGAIQPTPSNEECGIREVWAYNLDREFDNIRKVAQTYKYVAMVSRLASR